MSTEKHIPSEALAQLLAPDGYYTYLGISKQQVLVGSETAADASGGSAAGGTAGGSGPVSTVDEDAVKKAYRRLSRKHHPDKGGDADTFRVLNRAQRVLLNNKLRQQYDILGIDLDDDEEHESPDPGDNDSDDVYNNEKPSTVEGIVHEIASMALTSIIQLGVRTLMMGVVAVFLVVYRLSLYPALLFLAYIAVQMFRNSGIPGASKYDPLSPICIAAGLVLMHTGRSDEGGWTYTFWTGEAVVLGMFTFNSIATVPKTSAILLALLAFSVLASLWFRGNMWNYAIVIGLEAFLAVVIAMAFPVMELILETVLNDKLRKVGDKVRSHHQQLEAFYAAKLERNQ